MSSTEELNNQWAFHLIDQLILQGVCHFWIAPGSRNTPLVLSIANHLKSKCTVHFDERGLAYHALGFSKGSRRPVVVVTTSGSAVGNLLPALMEAKENNLPLLILTADRPKELQECGANQTTHQTKIFSQWTVWDTELSTPSSSISVQYLRSMVGYTLHMLKKGPVHINCPFREPLFLDPFPIPSIPTCIYHPNEEIFFPASLKVLAKQLNSSKKGIVILGENQKEELKEIYPLIDRLQWPVYADLLSNERCYPSHRLISHCPSTLFETPIDCILQFGHKVISKKLQMHIKSQKPNTYILVSSALKRQDELFYITDQVLLNNTSFCTQILPFIQQRKPLEDPIKKRQIVTDYPLLSEPFIHLELGKHFPKDYSIFFANSMPIRDADQFFFPKNKPQRMFFQRGVSGIDGNIASCFGIAKAIHTPLIAVLGDLAVLHDLNSLALAKDSTSPVIFLILNNQGGGIFSHLPIVRMSDHFEQFFAAKHSFTFEKAASFFGIDYQYINTKQDLIHSFQKGWSAKTQIIELKTEREENAKHRQQIQECSHLQPKASLQKNPLSSYTGF